MFSDGAIHTKFIEVQYQNFHKVYNGTEESIHDCRFSQEEGKLWMTFITVISLLVLPSSFYSMFLPIIMIFLFKIFYITVIVKA